MSLGKLVAEFIVALLKGIFGRDEQEQFSVSASNGPTINGDDALLADIGLQHNPGTKDADRVCDCGSGQADCDSTKCNSDGKTT